MIKVGDRVRNWWGNWGKIIEISDGAVYILMDNANAISDGDGETGVEIALLKDVGDERSRDDESRKG